MSVFQKRKSRLEGMSAMPTPDIYVGNGPSVTIDTAPSQGSLDEKICRFGKTMPLQSSRDAATPANISKKSRDSSNLPFDTELSYIFSLAR
jgi:hypothetical protein